MIAELLHSSLEHFFPVALVNLSDQVGFFCLGDEIIEHDKSRDDISMSNDGIGHVHDIYLLELSVLEGREEKDERPLFCTYGEESLIHFRHQRTLEQCRGSTQFSKLYMAVVMSRQHRDFQNHSEFLALLDNYVLISFVSVSKMRDK